MRHYDASIAVIRLNQHCHSQQSPSQKISQMSSPCPDTLLTWHDENVTVFVTVVDPVTGGTVADGEPRRLVADQLRVTENGMKFCDRKFSNTSKKDRKLGRTIPNSVTR